jgi:hypothetical protein
MAENGQSTEDVYEWVRAAILDGELAPGTVMSQVALARGVRDQPHPAARGAADAPEQGLVEGEPNRRVRVAPMSVQDVEELCVMRITLEAEALRLSVSRITSEDIARLEGHMAEMAHYAQEKDYRRWTLPHRPGAQLAGHLARTGFQVAELLDPAFDPRAAERSAYRRRRRATKAPGVPTDCSRLSSHARRGVSGQGQIVAGLFAIRSGTAAAAAAP